MITSGFQRGLMKAVGASAGTLRRLSAFISRRVCTAASTPCAAGPCCSPTFRSAKSMNMRRRRRIAKSHRISRADDFAPVCPSKGLRSNGATFSMHVREPASFYGTALDADLRTRGVSTLVMAGISTTGVVLSSVARASDADYDVRLVQGLLLRPGSGCPRSSVAFRVRRTCTGRVIFGPRMIAAIAAGGLVRGRASPSQGAVIAAPATLKNPSP